MKPTNRPLVFVPLCVFLLLAVTAPAQALKSDRTKPITIESNSAVRDDVKGTTTYTGSVKIRQGSMRLSANRVTVARKQNGDDLFVATGTPARFSQRPEGRPTDMVGYAERIEYTTNGDTLILIGNATVNQGKDKVASDRIVYNRVTAIVKAGASARGKERVRVTIIPNNQ